MAISLETHLQLDNQATLRLMFLTPFKEGANHLSRIFSPSLVDQHDISLHGRVSNILHHLGYGLLLCIPIVNTIAMVKLVNRCSHEELCNRIADEVAINTKKKARAILAGSAIYGEQAIIESLKETFSIEYRTTDFNSLCSHLSQQQYFLDGKLHYRTPLSADDRLCRVLYFADAVYQYGNKTQDAGLKDSCIQLVKKACTYWGNGEPSSWESHPEKTGHLSDDFYAELETL